MAVSTAIDHIQLRPLMYVRELSDEALHSDLLKRMLDKITAWNSDPKKRSDGAVEVNLDDKKVEICYHAGIIPCNRMELVFVGVPSGGMRPSNFPYDYNWWVLATANALSSRFVAESIAKGKMRRMVFEKGRLVDDTGEMDAPAGAAGLMRIAFQPDKAFWGDYAWREDVVETMLREYACLHTELAFTLNGDRWYEAPQGLQDLLTDRLTAKPLYPIIHLLDGGGSWDNENRCVKDSVELAFTHCNQSGERYYSYFSGRCTPQGGRHQDALRREIVHTLNAYYGIKWRADCLCNGLVAALSVHIESCPTGDEQEVWNEIVKSKYDFTVKAKRLICDFVREELPRYLRQHPDTAELLRAVISGKRSVISD